MLKVSVLLIVICCIQAIYSVPEQGVSPETKQKLAAAIQEVSLAKRESGDRVNAIRNIVGNRIDAAWKPIKQHLNDLKTEVKRAKKDAKNSQTNIDECLNAENEAIQRVDKEVIKHCKQMKETEQAGSKVGEIAYQVRRLRRAFFECRVPEQDACVSQTIDDVKARVAQLQQEIVDILKHASPEKQDKCISNSAHQLQAQIDKIAQDWRTCLNQLKPSSA